MPPLPGQAPEQPISIIFDGGSKGNPGVGYGSYALRWPGQPQQIVQLQFGDGVTNNEAEYDTLVAALESVVKRLAEQKADPATARVEIRGDSQLVINQVLGEWKCSDERMRRRRDRVRSLLREFGSWELAHHPRANSVRAAAHGRSGKRTVRRIDMIGMMCAPVRLLRQAQTCNPYLRPKHPHLSSPLTSSGRMVRLIVSPSLAAV